MKKSERAEFIREKLPLLFNPPERPASGELLSFGKKLVRGERLEPGESGRAMEIMMEGRAGPHETALFLSALEPEESGPEELAAMARAMRARAIRVRPEKPMPLLGDNCGTGGDNLHLFNISTAAMFIIGAAGLPIAKHGNRASTSRSGSADVLEELGVRIECGPKEVARCIERVGIGFMFAPLFHPAMKHVAAVRRALPFRTVFNMLGPLCNPAPVTYQMIGVSDPAIQDLVSRALPLLGVRRALVVCGRAGAAWMDEVSTVGPTRAILIEAAKSREIEIEPSSAGLSRGALEALRGGAPSENAAILRGILTGTDRSPRREIALLNASAALFGAALARDIEEGMAMARDAVDDGRALKKLELLIEESAGRG